MRSRWFATVALAGLVASACGNAGSGDEAGETPRGGTDRPGVTADEIRVGGVASLTNPTGAPLDSTFDGVEAYFDLVNDAGGVHGRRLVLTSRRDDATAASRNLAQTRALVEQDKVFAVLPMASVQFTAADYLAEHGVPTFGWNINAEWSKGPNLFGQRGSYTCFECPAPSLPFVAREIGAEKVGIIAYSAPQSRDCAVGVRNSFERYGADLVFEDTSLPFGFVELAADIRRMRTSGVQFVATCMDGNGSAKVARAIREADLDIPLYLPNGYDHEFVRQNAADLEGSWVGALFVPFEEAESSPGIRRFLDAMERAGKTANELALVGWIGADMFVEGLKDAGPDFDRASVVAAVNAVTDYTADSIIPPIDWRTAHDAVDGDACTAFLRVEGGELVPEFGEPGKPFVCFPTDTDTIPEPAVR
jgi:ABC-type branched-subunit amino acid transport system substrate-binding protein